MKTKTIIQKLGVALLLLMLTTLYSQAYAQSHNVKCPSCKYYQRPAGAKNVVNTGCVCEACRDKNEKERKAKQAEDKRRQDALIAENQRKAKAEADRIKREQEQNKPTAVVITTSGISENTNPTKAEEKKEVKKEKNYFYSLNEDRDYSLYRRVQNSKASMLQSYIFSHSPQSGGFLINNKRHFENEYAMCIGKNRFDYPKSFPPNIGIVVLKETRSDGNNNLPIMDFIDINGNRLLNDNQIYLITHLHGDLFLISRGGMFEGHTSTAKPDDQIGPAYIYNIKTNKKINIEYTQQYADGRRNVQISLGRGEKFCNLGFTVYQKSKSRYENYYYYCIKNENEIEIYEAIHPHQNRSFIKTLKFE